MQYTGGLSFRSITAAINGRGNGRTGRGVVSLAILAALGVAHLSAGTIKYTVTPLGVNGSGESTYQYDYFLSGFDFRNTTTIVDEFDVRFDPIIFDQLFGAIVAPGFNVFLFQPNVPPGVAGDFSVAAVVDHPSLNGTFRVNAAVKIGQTLPSGAALNQTFTFDEFNGSSVLQSTTPGVTSPLQITTGIPEPGNFQLIEASTLLGCLTLVIKRRLMRSGVPR
jgi:hypothetical protein